MTDAIFYRRSVRAYEDRPVDDATLEKICTFCQSAKPLHPHIRVQGRVVRKEQVRFYFPWKAPQLLAIYSENMAGYLENVGFLFQQVDLYLQSLGLGSCWMGLGKLREQLDVPNGMDFVILIAFGYPDGVPPRSDAKQFHRRSMEEITDRPDPRLEPARLAPSSTNSQPWFFVHGDDTIHAYRSCAGLLRHKMLGSMNQIDIGIALAHLYVSNPDGFRFFTAEAPELKGYDYAGSFTL